MTTTTINFETAINSEIQTWLNEHNQEIADKVVKIGYMPVGYPIMINNFQFLVSYRGVGLLEVKKPGRGMKHEFSIKW